MPPAGAAPFMVQGCRMLAARVVAGECVVGQILGGHRDAAHGHAERSEDALLHQSGIVHRARRCERLPEQRRPQVGVADRAAIAQGRRPCLGDDPVNILDVGVAAGEQQQVLLDGRRRGARQAGAVAGELGERHVGGGGSRRAAGASPTFVSAVTSPRAMASASSSDVKVLVIEPISYSVVVVRAEMSIGDGRAVDGRDTDPVECPGQMRERPSGERRIAGHNRSRATAGGAGRARRAG